MKNSAARFDLRQERKRLRSPQVESAAGSRRDRRRRVERRTPRPPLGLYIHIPFCARKCPYCDFNTYARLEPLYESYTEALCEELTRWAARLGGRTVHTVFIGGGTPTVLSAGQLVRILALVHDQFSLAEDVEISSEANPGIEDRGQFALLRSLGVNRLSLGVQSFQADELAFLGRIHSADDTLRGYDAALRAGFANINLDFMFGLPRQSAQAWDDTLDKALELAPRHLSLYSLIVEPDTPLAHWVQTGQTAAPDDDSAAALYETAMARLRTAGYAQYEVSNWARGAEFACRHNLIYWRNQEWIGVGPGAHSHLRYPLSARIQDELPQDFSDAARFDLRQVRKRLRSPQVEPEHLRNRSARECAGNDSSQTESSNPGQAAVRWSNCKGVQGYIKRIKSGATPVDFHEELSTAVSMGETMMLGLRLVQEGTPFARFEATHGQPMRAVFGPKLDRLQDVGLLESNEERVRLTSRGLLLGNRVFSEFIV